MKMRRIKSRIRKWNQRIYKPLTPVTIGKFAIKSLEAGGAVKCSSSILKMFDTLKTIEKHLQ